MGHIGLRAQSRRTVHFFCSQNDDVASRIGENDREPREASLFSPAYPWQPRPAATASGGHSVASEIIVQGPRRHSLVFLCVAISFP